MSAAKAIGRNRVSIFWLLLACSGLLCSTPLQADFFTHRFENQHQERRTGFISPEFSFYTTSSNFDENGANVTPNTFSRYSRLQAQVSSAYGLNSFVTAFGRFSWLRNDVTTPTGGGGNIFRPGDQTLGFNFRLTQRRRNSGRKRPYLVDLQLQTDFPVYRNTNASMPYAGNGTTDLTFAFFVDIPVSKYIDGKWRWIASAGYTMRPSGFSTLFQWDLKLKYGQETAEEYLFGIEIFGAQSLTKKSMINAGNGALGSYIVNSPSPSFFGIQGIIDYQLEEDRKLSFALGQTLSGKNTPVGFSTSLRLNIGFDNPKETVITLGPPAVQPPVGPSQPIPTPPPPTNAKVTENFLTYTLEAKVIRVSDRLNLIKIDRGRQDGVEIKQIFDIFTVKKDGSLGESIARGECTSVQPSQAVIRITEYYKEVWIEEGFVAKRPLP